MSFESDSEKNTPTNTTQIHRNSLGSEFPGDARAASRCPARATRRASRARCPPETPSAEEPPRLLTIGNGRQVPREMLVHEEKLQEIRSCRAASQCQGTVMT
jgi:hypothetical protein